MIYINYIIRLGVIGGGISRMNVDIDSAGAGVGSALSGIALRSNWACSQQKDL